MNFQCLRKGWALAFHCVYVCSTRANLYKRCLYFIKEPRGQVLEMPDAQDHLSVGTILPGEGVGLGQVNCRCFAATGPRNPVLENYVQKVKDLK